MRGARGGRSKLYRSARETLYRALAYSYRDRKVRQREFRRLWITRINAAARINGLSYSSFMHGLKLANVDMDRKVLAHLAMHDADAFAKIAETARSHLATAKPASS